MISAQVRSNYERIRTWEGQVDVKQRTIYEGPQAELVFKTYTDATGKTPKMVVELMESRIQFRADLKTGLFYSRNERTRSPQYIDFETGRDLGSKLSAGYRISIVTPEYHLHLTSSKTQESLGTKRIAFKEEPPEECLPCEIPSVFDPRTLFEIPKPVWETFAEILQHISEHGEYVVDGYALKVEERVDGYLTEYRLRIPEKSGDGNHIFITRTSSSAKGYNMLLAEVTNVSGRLIKKGTLDYELIDGVFVPNRTIAERFTGQNGQRNYEKSAALKDLRMNHPIPAETFTYKNLGLRNRDRLIDNVLGKEYVYQDEQLIPADRKK
jgi:hypothetical protein